MLTKLILSMIMVIIPTICFAGANELCEPTIIYKEKIVYVDRIQEVPKEIIFVKNAKKNRLMLMVGNGPDSNINLTTTPTSATIRHPSDTLVGATYIRDFNRFSLGAYGLSNETIGISAGINW